MVGPVSFTVPNMLPAEVSLKHRRSFDLGTRLRLSRMPTTLNRRSWWWSLSRVLLMWERIVLTLVVCRPLIQGPTMWLKARDLPRTLICRARLLVPWCSLLWVFRGTA